jgi:tRNA 2-thiouridine synthesizing protein B
MAVYLVDKPQGQEALAIAALDDDAHIILIQDGVYLDTQSVADKAVYAVAEDVKRRGLVGRLPTHVKLIDYGEVIDLVLAHKVVNFA